jgi:hypothetical protein
MSFEFVEELRRLHQKAKNGALSKDERARYNQARLQLSRLVVVSQQLGHSGPTLRSTFRMAKVLKVEVEPSGGPPTKGSTVDLATGGFAMLMPTALPVGRPAKFTLHLPRTGAADPKPISGPCKVASCRGAGGLFRVSFKFDQLPPDVEEQLSIALIDAVLERFSA